MIKKLTQSDIKKRIEKMSEWEVNAKCSEITRTFRTVSFVAGLSLVARIAVHAEILNHHPVIELHADKVKIKLSTHSVKGLTKLDFELAKRIDSL